MHVVRPLAPPRAGEDHAKDIDSSPTGIARRWRSGREDARRVPGARPWARPFDPDEGLMPHEAARGRIVRES